MSWMPQAASASAVLMLDIRTARNIVRMLRGLVDGYDRCDAGVRAIEEGCPLGLRLASERSFEHLP